MVITLNLQNEYSHYHLTIIAIKLLLQLHFKVVMFVILSYHSLTTLPLNIKKVVEW